MAFRRCVCLSVVPLLLLGLGACATKRYGRMQDVTSVEEQYLTCKDIEMELAEIAAVRKKISDAEVDGRSVLVFLDDFGISNANGER